jgi:hypothetical protein
MMADKRKPIVQMTVPELDLLDFEKMSPAERQEFRQELTDKPGEPLSVQAVHGLWAHAESLWSRWIALHPEDDHTQQPGTPPVFDHGTLTPMSTRPMSTKPSPSTKSSSDV